MRMPSLNYLRDLLLVTLCIAGAGPAAAFTVFPIDAGHSLKWGDNANGTPGGTVRWSFIPAGTGGSAYCGTACTGSALSNLNIEVGPGLGYASTPLADLATVITATFAKWSAVADIQFVGPNTDPGLAIDDPAAGVPEIRIGVFAFTGGGGAVGFAPPPNGGTGAGDILFDANSFYAFQPGAEGDVFFPGTSTAPNDFVSLLLHEMGHAIGLAHPATGQVCQVMDVSAGCLGRINRELDADDIAGAQFLYGAPVPLPAAWWMMVPALGALGARRRA